jgi:hypothetical protein
MQAGYNTGAAENHHKKPGIERSYGFTNSPTYFSDSSDPAFKRLAVHTLAEPLIIF